MISSKPAVWHQSNEHVGFGVIFHQRYVCITIILVEIQSSPNTAIVILGLLLWLQPLPFPHLPWELVTTGWFYISVTFGLRRLYKWTHRLSALLQKFFIQHDIPSPWDPPGCCKVNNSLFLFISTGTWDNFKKLSCTYWGTILFVQFYYNKCGKKNCR